jgi:hypothetical protein
MESCWWPEAQTALSDRGDRGDLYSRQPLEHFRESVLKYTTRKFLTSGGKEYVPEGLPGYNSPFAARFLEALRSGGGADHYLTIPRLFDYVQRAKPLPVWGEWGKNQAGSDFLFIHNLARRAAITGEGGY